MASSKRNGVRTGHHQTSALDVDDYFYDDKPIYNRKKKNLPSFDKRKSINTRGVSTPKTNAVKKPSIKANRKKSKYEDKWEQRTSNCDLFDGLVEPIVESPELVDDIDDVPPVTFTCLREKKIQAIVSSAPDLELTKKGNLRSTAEVVGIVKAKVRSRIKKKAAKLRSFEERAKARDLERRATPVILNEPAPVSKVVSNEDWKKSQVALAKKKAKEKNRKRYTPTQKSAFREMAQKNKLAKKQRKKANQAVRKLPKTEAGESARPCNHMNYTLGCIQCWYSVNPYSDPDFYRESKESAFLGQYSDHYDSTDEHTSSDDVKSEEEFHAEATENIDSQEFYDSFKLDPSKDLPKSDFSSYLSFELESFFKRAKKEASVKIMAYKDIWATFLYAHQMYCSPSIEMDISLSIGYAFNMCDNDLLSILGPTGLFINSFRHRSRHPVTESLSSNLADLASYSERILDCTLVSALRQIVLIVVSWKIFSKDFSKTVMTYFGKLDKSYSIPEALTLIFSSLSQLVRAGEMIVAGAKFSDLLFCANPVDTAIAQGNNLLIFENRLYYGLPIEGRMDFRVFIRQSGNVLDILDVALKKKFNPLSDQYLRCNKLVNSLRTIREGVMMRSTRQTRIAPVAFVIAGKPGIGKSSVMNIVYQAHEHARGRIYDPCCVFEKPFSSEYWDGYNPWTHSILHISEPGSMKKELAQRQGDSSLDELLSIVDSVPYTLNMAAVEDKGKFQCLAEAVVIDTNNADMNISHTYSNPAAFRRRFLYIEPTVKPEYQKENSIELDPSKGDPENYFDKWTFHVYVQDALDATKSKKRTIFNKCNSNELKNFLVDYVQDKVRIGEKDRAQREQDLFAEGEQEEEEAKLEAKILSVEIDDRSARYYKYVCTSIWSLIMAIFPLLQAFVLTVESNMLLVRYTDQWYIRRDSVIVLAFVGFIFYSTGFLSYYLMWLMLVLFAFDFVGSAESAVHRVIDNKQQLIFSSFKLSYDRYVSALDYISGKAYEFVSRTKYYIAGLGILLAFFNFYWRNKRTETTEASSFAKDTVIADKVRKFEDDIGCKKSYKRVNVNETKIWNTQIVERSRHTSGPLSLHNHVYRNVRKCEIQVKDISYRTHVLGIKANFVIANLHAFGKDHDEFNIKVYPVGCDGLDSKAVIVRVYRSEFKHLKEDLILFQLNGITFKDITVHFPSDDIQFANADGYINGDKTVASRHADAMQVDDKNLGTLSIGPVVKYRWNNHASGMCGLPIVAQRDAGSCIVGIHSAGSSKNEVSYGIVIMKKDIARCLEESNTILAPIFSESQLIRYGSDPHPKSPIRYEDLGPISYYGCVRTPNMHQKSSLRKSVFYGAHLDEVFFNALGHVRSVKYVPPLMQPRYGKEFVSPYNYAIRKMNISRKSLSPGRLYKAVDMVYSKILNNLRARGIPRLTPIDMESAINGIPHDAYIRRMDMTKAAGFETPGPKSSYADRIEDHEGYQIYDDIDDSIKEEVLKAVDCYFKGEHYGPVYKAQLKDEPRDIEKVKIGKTRVFFASPFAYLILQRMFLSPLYSLMIEFSNDFYTSIGIDMHRHAHLFHERLTSFSTLIVEGDYEGYDQRMPFEIGHGANTIILRLLGALGYDEAQLRITSGILSDGLFPFLDFIGEMMCVPGLQPSGKYGTAEDNSIRNLLIMVYSYLTLGRDDFFEQVLPCTYGDDVLAAVKPEVKDVFNNITLSQVIAQETDMRFTSSSKGDIVDPFISVEKMSFLKRTFRYHKILNHIVGCLDLDSVYKSLQWVSPSSAVNIQTQIHQISQSALRELFFHCDNSYVFDQFRDFLSSIIEKNYGDGTDRLHLITYTTLANEFLHPLQETVRGGGQELEQDLQFESAIHFDATLIHEETRANNTSLDFGQSEDLNKWPARFMKITKQVAILEQQLRVEKLKLDEMKTPYPGLNYRQVKQSEMYVQNEDFRKDVDEFYACSTLVDSLKLTIARLWALINRHDRGYSVVTESDTVEMSIGPASSGAVDEHENVVDIGGDEKSEIPVALSSYLSTGQDHSLKLDQFFSRPLAITNGTITGGGLSFNLDIWNAYLSHPSIRSKLRNYSFLRANLHVRIAFSASPFHYGKIMIAYEPFADQNENLTYLNGLLNKRPLATYLSQSPGRQILDIKENKPIEMVLPYISPQPMGRLFLDSPLVIASGQDFTELDLGRLYVQNINDILCAAPNPSSASYFIYAWMEDINLGAPTGTVISIDTEADERKTGPIQRFASRASEIAYALTSVPSIAPLARASAITLEGVASLSSLFGFSVPVMNNEPSRVKNEPFQNGAHTIGYDTSKRIVLDPKQELSVDPRVTGSDEDEMSIAYIASIESYMDGFSWLESSAPLSTALWMCPVNPFLCKEYLTVGTTYVVQPTALAMAAAPFEYWRGDITYRFEVVCSAYHRGKLAFYFEPNVAQNVVIDTVLDMNKQFVKIIDIQETQEVCFTVKWAFPKPWAHVATNNTLKTVGDIGLDITSFPELFDSANGYIAVVPFTKIQSPDGSGVEINVYVSSDNIMFNQFCSERLPESRPTTESETVDQSTCMDLNDSSANLDHISEEYFGETPVSFRSLLKRFSSNRFPRLVDFGTGNTLFLNGAIYPIPSPSFSSPAALKPSLYSYLRYAYLGMRGGMKHRIIVLGDVSFNQMNPVMVHLGDPVTIVDDFVMWLSNNNDLRYKSIGSVGYLPHVNGGIEFELPFYSNNAFLLSFASDGSGSHPAFDEKFSRTFACFMHASGRTGDIRVVDNFAIGEDFSFFRFQGASPYVYTV